MSTIKGNTNSQAAAAAPPVTDSLKDDPEQLLNEWLGELKTIIGDLDTKVAQNHSQGSPNKTAAITTTTTTTTTPAGVLTRNRRNRTSEFNRFSMANLEDTHETELDAILGELSLLEMQKPASMAIKAAVSVQQQPQTVPQLTATPSIINSPPLSEDCLSLPTAMINNNFHSAPTTIGHSTHHRSNSIVSTSATSTISSLSSSTVDPGYAESNNDSNSSAVGNGGGGGGGGSGIGGGVREPRTESPDNDSSFSDTVSLLSTDTSSTSSGLTTTNTNGPLNKAAAGHLYRGINLQEFDNQKAAKIHLALQKLEQASVRRLFVKAFTADGASKSLLVDETMTCGHVTRLLADKNHVHMDTRWALVEQLPDIQMERLYEDHELLVDKLMMWNRDSKNRILFVERVEKVVFFIRPEAFIPEHGLVASAKDLDECNRAYILEEFFNTNSQLAIEGGLYLRGDSKKGWKRHHFVLRGSGLYYYPKEKTRSPRDLVCLGLFNDCEVYKGFGWRKKHKAPTDCTFILHASHELANSKTTKPLKILCADDDETLQRWILAIRLAKYGKQLWQSYRRLREDLARDDFDEMATRRSSSINSFVGEATATAATTTTNAGGVLLTTANGRPLSRASSSSSSGCLSDENNGFDSEFTTGTIKRKPSMKPNLPLTSMTRQLKEVGESHRESPVGSPERGGTLTRQHQRQPPHHMRQRSVDSNGSSGGSGCSTLKRRPQQAVTFERKEEEEEQQMTGGGVTSPLKGMPSCMTDSLFSLPPPPEETTLLNNHHGLMTGPPQSVHLGSTFSLDSLPPPPSVNELEESLLESSFSSSLSPEMMEMEEVYSPTKGNLMMNNNRQMMPVPVGSLVVANPTPHPIIYAAVPKKELLESCLKKAATSTTTTTATMEKIYATKGELKPALKINAAAAAGESSPVTLRKKVCFEDQVQQQQQLQNQGSNNSSPSKRLTTSSTSSSIYGSLPPKPPPRSQATRLSTQPINAASSNNEFLKDLQRVMRKKWQVAQKCKAEPEMTPHEVLGFRDFDAWQKQNNQLPYYRQTANVSNWVQEHYGPDSLYENLGMDSSTGAHLLVAVAPKSPESPTNSAAVPIGKKRPPPLPPKRSETTHLTTQPLPSPTTTVGMNL